MSVHLVEGIRWGLVLNLRREDITTFTEGLYLVRSGRCTVFVFAKTRFLCIGYLRTGTKIIYRYVSKTYY